MIEYRVVVGTKKTSWYKPGSSILHRDDGPAVEHTNGDTEWFFDGKRHRIGGPAEECSRYKSWLIHGALHREDGAAIEYFDGDRSWYLDDIRFSSKEAWEKAKNPPVKELTVAEISELLGYEVKVVK